MTDPTLLERQLRASLEELQPAPLAKVGDMHAIVRAERFDFTPEQRQMIRDTYANGASDGEFQVLMEVAKARRLNPLLRQIHFVKRWDSMKGREVWAAQASIDGMRAIAQRTGLYNGQDEPEFSKDEDGQMVAKVRVYRKDWDRPAVGVAHWNEYAQYKKDRSLTPFWQRMPKVMLSKCAEAIGLRKAFPEDLSGLYAAEELQQERVDQETGEVLPRISPHGHAEPGEVFDRTEEELDALLLAIHQADTMEQLSWALEEHKCHTPDERDAWHPDRRKKIGQEWNRRKRQLENDLRSQGRL